MKETSNATTSQGHVFVIEDDESLRWMLLQTLKSNGLVCIGFDTPHRFFDAIKSKEFLPTGNCCLLLDMRLPGMSGIDVQAQLDESKVYMPIIFMSGSSHVSEVISSFKNGAADFLLKPFGQVELISAVQETLRKSRYAGDNKTFRLTPKELQVLQLVSKGKRNDEIAQELGLSVRTIKMHRSNIIHKTGASTMTEAALTILRTEH